MDYSSLNAEAFNVDWLFAPAILCALGIGVVVFIAVLGYAMKFSLSLSGGGSHGFWWSLLIVFCGSIAAGTVNVIVTVMFGVTPWYVLMLYSLMVWSVVIMMFARCNPFSAMATTLVYSVFSTIGLTGVMLATLLVMMAASSNMRDAFAKPSSDFMPGKLTANGEVPSADAFGGFQPEITNSFFKGSDGQSNENETHPVSYSPNDGVPRAGKSAEAFLREVRTRQLGAERNSVREQGRAVPQVPPAFPVGSNIQSNPFAQ